MSKPSAESSIDFKWPLNTRADWLEWADELNEMPMMRELGRFYYLVEFKDSAGNTARTLNFRDRNIAPPSRDNHLPKQTGFSGMEHDL